MPLEDKQNQQDSFQDLSVTSNIETRKEKGEFTDPEIGVVDLGARPLEFFDSKQTSILDAEGFIIPLILPYTEARDQNYLFSSPYQAFRPCQLIGITVYYTQAASGGAKIDIYKGTTGGGNKVNISDIPLTLTAKTTYIYEGSDFDKQYTHLAKGDWIRLQSVNTLTNILDLCMNFHFKYSGRGETRYDT